MGGIELLSEKLELTLELSSLLIGPLGLKDTCRLLGVEVGLETDHGELKGVALTLKLLLRLEEVCFLGLKVLNTSLQHFYLLSLHGGLG